MKKEINILKYADQLRIRVKEEKAAVFDPVRKKWIQLLPEEMVRQCLLHYLIDEGKIPLTRIQVERLIKVNQLNKRYDIIIYDQKLNPWMLVEVKNPKIKIDQKVFDQIARYNLAVKVPYLMVSNGNENYFCKIDFQNGSYAFLDQPPF